MALLNLCSWLLQDEPSRLHYALMSGSRRSTHGDCRVSFVCVAVPSHPCDGHPDAGLPCTAALSTHTFQLPHWHRTTAACFAPARPAQKSWRSPGLLRRGRCAAHSQRRALNECHESFCALLKSLPARHPHRTVGGWHGCFSHWTCPTAFACLWPLQPTDSLIFASSQ